MNHCIIHYVSKYRWNYATVMRLALSKKFANSVETFDLSMTARWRLLWNSLIDGHDTISIGSLFHTVVLPKADLATASVCLLPMEFMGSSNCQA